MNKYTIGDHQCTGPDDAIKKLQIKDEDVVSIKHKKNGYYVIMTRSNSGRKGEGNG